VSAVAALAIGLSACGGDDEGDAGSGGTSAASGGSEAWTFEEPTEPITLTVWDRSILSLNDEWSDQLLADWEAAHPNVKVKFVKQPADIAQADQAFRAASIAKNGPDVTTLYTGGMVNSFRDFLEPQDSYWSDDEIADLAGWDTVRADFDAEGDLLAAPYGAGLYFEVFCNQKNLKKAGVTIDTPPETWEAFLDLMQQVKDGGETPVVTGNQEGYMGAWVLGALVGGQIGTEGFFAMRGGDTPVDDPAMLTGLQKFAELYSNGLTNEDAGTLTDADGTNKFMNGEGACFISGDWQDGDLVKNLGEENVITFPIPVLEGSELTGARTGGPASALAVTNYSQNKDAAMAFVKFVLDAKQLDKAVAFNQAEPSNHADADQSVIENPLLRQQAEFTTAATAKGEEYLIFPFDSIMPQEVNDVFYRMNAAVFTGQETPENAVKEIKAAYDEWAESQP
jgi:ABC-type glycerol-3-phosphate transport system substrate-binding protein